MIELSMHQLAIQLTIVQITINYQTMILQVSYKSSSIISTANHTISSAFPFEQHANPITIYLRMIGLSINQHTVQLTIVQRNINLPNHDLARLLQFKQHYIYCKSHN